MPRCTVPAEAEATEGPLGLAVSGIFLAEVPAAVQSPPESPSAVDRENMPPPGGRGSMATRRVMPMQRPREEFRPALGPASVLALEDVSPEDEESLLQRKLNGHTVLKECMFLYALEGTHSSSVVFVWGRRKAKREAKVWELRTTVV